VVEPDGLVAQVGGEPHRVGHEGDGRPLTAKPVEVIEALALELLVAHGDDLVDDEDFRVEIDGDGEPEPHVHPGGVDLDGRVDEVADVGELDDLVDRRVDLALAHPEDRPVEVDVLASGELPVKARTEFQERGDTAVHQQPSRCGPVDAGEDLEHGRLAGAVVADEAEGRAAGDVEAHVVESLEVRGTARAPPDEALLQRVPPLAVEGELLGDVLHPDRRVAHSCSPRSAPRRWKVHDAHPSATRVQTTTLTQAPRSPTVRS